MILTDGTRIFTEERKGTDSGKPTVVFIHGDGQNHTIWASLEEYFVANGHGILSYDLPGHGLSEPYRKREYSFGRFAGTIEEILTAYEVRNPLLVGNSSGGMIALEYATRYEPSAVVAISSSDVSPAAHNPEVSEVIKAYVSKSRELFEGQRLFRYDGNGLRLEDIGLAALKFTSPEGIEGNMTALKTFDIRGGLYRIKSPVLAIRGSEDPYVTGECMERIRQRVAKVRTVDLEKQGHHVLLESSQLILKSIEDDYSFLVQA